MLPGRSEDVACGTEAAVCEVNLGKATAAAHALVHSTVNKILSMKS